MNTTDPIEIQLNALLDSGVSLEDACETLGIDVDGAKAFLGSKSKKEVGVEDILKEYKPICLRALISIGLDPEIENVSARVAALKIIVDGGGELPQLPIDKFSDAFKKMKEITGGYKRSETLTTPSATTVQVDIKNPSIASSSKPVEPKV